MINSPTELHNNPFDMVSNHISENTYWLNEKKITKSSILKLNLPDTLILTPEKARKTNNAKAIGLSIAGAVVVIAGGIFELFSGGPKGLSKWFQKLRGSYERKLQQSKLGDIRKSGHYEYILGEIDKLQHKIEAINNFTTIKDYAFKKLMYGPKNNFKVTKKIHEKITKIFENFGLKTVKGSYKKTSKQFDALEDLNKGLIARLRTNGKIDKPLTINDVTQTKGKWLKDLQKYGKDISQTYQDNFGTTAQESRYLEIKKFIGKLEKSFDGKNSTWFLSKDMFNKFIAEAAIAPEKTAMQNKIKTIKHSLSYNPKNLYTDIDNCIMKISSALGSGDKDSLMKLNRTREMFKQLSQGKPVNDKIMEDLYNDLNTSLLKSAHGKSPESLDLITRNLGDMQSLYMNYKQGKIQDVLNIYEKLLPKDEYAKVAKAYSKAVQSLEKSIKLETEDFVSKSRDLTMGSAPTDILSILTGFGALGYYLTKADDNKERMSIALKYGFPALAGVGVSLYGNARLFAGTKSMILGAISTLVIGKIGDMANNMLNKYYPADSSNSSAKQHKYIKKTITKPPYFSTMVIK